jgi:L-lactate dehydrogenase
MRASILAPVHRAADLLDFAGALLRAAGLPADRAAVVAEVLLEGGLLGHTTHGLDMLAAYLGEIEAGRMARGGEPEVVRDAGPARVWDGRYLPGPWLVKRAIAAATERLAHGPVAIVAIRRSHHIGCLQAYLKPVTDAGLVILLACSDPSGAGVTPHGGVASRITPNPLAAGFPTAGDPVLIDVSMSTTTNAMTRRLAEAGQAVLFGERRGAVLPLGGLDLGHKGFALALMVEALTSALAGHGRADQPKSWGASVFLMLLDPARFGGRDAFVRETSWLAERCRTTPVAPGAPPVRLPGEAALARRARQLAEGVALHATVMPKLRPWAERFGVALPAAS